MRLIWKNNLILFALQPEGLVDEVEVYHMTAEDDGWLYYECMISWDDGFDDGWDEGCVLKDGKSDGCDKDRKRLRVTWNDDGMR